MLVESRRLLFFVELLLMLLIIYDFKLSILQESKSFWSYQ